jgi:hypothetical protein
VILVNDVVAGAQVGEALQRSSEPRVRSWRTLAEDLGIGKQDEPEVAPDEAATGRRNREEQLGLVRQRLAGLEQPRLDPAEQVERPQGLAAVRKGDHDPLACPDERTELVLGLCETPCSERRPLGLEGNGLIRGSGSSSAESARFGSAFSSPVIRTPLLPDEAEIERGTESVGHRRRLLVTGGVGSPKSDAARRPDRRRRSPRDAALAA